MVACVLMALPYWQLWREWQIQQKFANRRKAHQRDTGITEEYRNHNPRSRKRQDKTGKPSNDVVSDNFSKKKKSVVRTQLDPETSK